jgi:hypothetical protein
MIIEQDGNLDENEDTPSGLLDCLIIAPPFPLVLECLGEFLNETGC